MPATRSYRSQSPRAGIALLVALALGCEGERVVERSVVLRLPDATSCAPASSLASLRVRVLGDGPGEPSSIVSLAPDAPIRALPSLPYPTRVVLAIAEAPGWRGVGWRALGSAGEEIALLPPGLSCPIGDPDARAPEGAQLAVLADGTLLLAGGLDDGGRATGRVVLLPPGAQVGETTPARLGFPTAFGTATAIDAARVVIAGGAIAASAPAYDQFEILDPRVDAARVIEPLSRPRRDHAALRLRDGRVVLIGGRTSSDGEGIDAIEVIDPERPESAVLDARLAAARVAPWVALAEDGRVWIAGGALRDEDAGVIERLDVEGDVIERFEIVAPAPLALAWVRERLVWVARDEVHVIALHGDAPVASRALDAMPLETARAVSTAGRALVVGSEGESRAAYVLDLGTGRVSTRAASRVPSALVAMIDESVVELAATGASLRREEGPTPFDEPPATLLFASDETWWTSDPVGDERWTAPRFEVRGGALVALEAGARVDVRALRGTRWDVGLVARGAVELRVIGDAGTIGITIDDDEMAIDGCRAVREGDAVIAIAPGVITLGERRCAVEDLGEVGLAFVAREPSAELVSLRLTRR
ncbi:kelch motif/HYR domain protein [Sandaracinus amylolyticus]|uniref:Kelch motif/HYR domain protein n=2 Tax=Sandaracinus amylolyticus TaxID=927083 RepID=A0A0F6W148_9BACT|nr:kelch motif/HYR domain protein [Sandaracinus amylolyticus]